MSRLAYAGAAALISMAALAGASTAQASDTVHLSARDGGGTVMITGTSASEHAVVGGAPRSDNDREGAARSETATDKALGFAQNLVGPAYVTADVTSQNLPGMASATLNYYAFIVSSDPHVVTVDLNGNKTLHAEVAMGNERLGSGDFTDAFAQATLATPITSQSMAFNCSRTDRRGCGIGAFTVFGTVQSIDRATLKSVGSSFDMSPFLIHITLYASARTDHGGDVAGVFLDPMLIIDPFTADRDDYSVYISPAFTNATLDAPPAHGGIPEPAAWALMLAGFGGLGVTLRRRRPGPATAA